MVQERRKRGGNKLLGNKKQAAGPQPSVAKGFAMQPQPIQKVAPVDPLVKMQQEKELKKLEEQKKKEYDDKKNSLKAKNESRKEELIK